IDRWGAAMLYRLISEPFELAPIVGVFPIVPNKRTEFLLGVDALKNLGHWTLHLGYANEFKQGEGETAYGGNHHVLEPGVFYRFGLHGIMGVQYTYQTLPPIVTLVQTPFGPMSVTTPATTIGMWGPVLGGSISKNMFLGLAQRFGVNRSSPDYMTTLQFQLYFGPYALGSWGL
ncbi:MAG: hypothetical protein HY475_00985, partial [Candidatus Terrybacteria bacterium]|nr:hypothetical protein [Candidatus Terrybacteria bacterium]